MRAILNNKTPCCPVHNLKYQEWMDIYTISTHSSQANPHPEISSSEEVNASWNVMAHAQKPDFIFRRNGRVHLNRRWASVQSTTGAAEVCASAVVMLDTPCSEVVWRVLATDSIRQFPFTSPPLRHRVPSHFNWSLHLTANIVLFL